jgi:hypothetical protein
MSPLTTSVRAELARAIRIVNLDYAKLSEGQQAQVEMIDLDPVDVAIKSGEDDHALAVVADWSHRQLEAIRAASR